MTDAGKTGIDKLLPFVSYNYDCCLFTATVYRKPASALNLVADLAKSSPKSSPKSSLKTEDRIIELILQDALLSAESLGETLGITKRTALKQIDKLKLCGRLRRVSPARGGYCEVV